MQLQNFECQIAKAQIGRYLAGDLLSEEAMEQLEAHIAKCADCKQNLAERRTLLQAMVSPAADEAPEPAEPARRRFDLATFIRSKIQAKQQVHAAVQTGDPKPSTITKPAVYSIALGAVLIGMSYLSKNMGSMLGPKAAQTIGTTPTATPPVKSAPVVLASSPVAQPKAAPPKPAPKPQSTPKLTRKAQPKPEPAVLHTHKAPRHHSNNTIRVYAPEK